MAWDFIGVYIVNRTLHGHLEKRNFSSRVEIFFNTRREISYLQAALIEVSGPDINMGPDGLCSFSFSDMFASKTNYQVELLYDSEHL